MGIEQVGRLLRESAAEVPAPQLAEAAWARAVKVRRRRQNLLAATVLAPTVAAVAVVVVTVRGGHGGTPVRPQTSPPQTISRAPSVPVDRIPATLSARTGVSLPRNLGNLAGSPVLGSGSIRRADALYEPSGAKPEPVYVLSGGAFYRLDVTLQFTLDPAKHALSPLRPTSLSADGRLVAFPQPDKVVVVDLATAQVTNVKVAGFNAQVLWRSSRSLLVGQSGAVYAVDVEHESATPVPGGLSLADAAAGAAGNGTVLELANGAGLPVREWTIGTAAPRVDAKVDQRGLGRYRVAAWTGPAWRTGDLVVRAGRSDSPHADVVAVLHGRSGRVVRVLAASATPLGWLDQHTVVMQARNGVNGVIAWDIDTGLLTSIAAPFDGTLALP